VDTTGPEHYLRLFYLTLCTLSFEIKESRLTSLSDTRCCKCGDKRNAAPLHEIFSAELFRHDVISLECVEKRINVINVNKATV